MAKLEELTPGAMVTRVVPDSLVTVVSTQRDFGVTSVNYDFADLLARAEAPR